MQIYTRVGDKGQTKIVGNYTVSKDSKRVEAYGSVDELNSLVGVAASSPGIWAELSKELEEIQHYLFDCGNDLATSNTKKYPYRMDAAPTKWLESIIDGYATEPKAVESFILPGGTRLAAELHYCRTVARRVERNIVAFQNDEGTNPYVLQFVNRLSDFFFAVARVANSRAGVDDVLYERGGKVFHLDVEKEEYKDPTEE